MSASQTPGNAGAPPAGNDPSMEDILASIRRILSEEEPAAVGAAPSAATAAPAAVETEAPEEPPEDVLVLDPSMLVEEPAAALPPPLPAEPAPPVVVVAASPPVVVPPPAPIVAPPPAPIVVPAPVAAPQPAPIEVMAQLPTLLAPETAAAATTAVGNLMRTLATERTLQVHRDGPTIEDIVREELRPLLKQWLDANLPDLVERLVRSEIERVVRRVVP